VDNNGHQWADFSLKDLGRLVKKSFRSIDIVGRYGGDEFIYLLPSTEVKNVGSVVKRAQDDIRRRGKTKFVSMENKRLGELLLDRGLINKKDLNQALKEQKINGKLLGAILVEKGLITNEKLSEILELQQKIKTVSLSRVEVSSSAVKLIPERLAKRFLSLAISKKENFLKVVMADPKDIIAIDTIRNITVTM